LLTLLYGGQSSARPIEVTVLWQVTKHARQPSRRQRRSLPLKWTALERSHIWWVSTF